MVDHFWIFPYDHRRIAFDPQRWQVSSASMAAAEIVSVRLDFQDVIEVLLIRHANARARTV